MPQNHTTPPCDYCHRTGTFMGPPVNGLRRCLKLEDCDAARLLGTIPPAPAAPDAPPAGPAPSIPAYRLTPGMDASDIAHVFEQRLDMLETALHARLDGVLAGLHQLTNALQATHTGIGAILNSRPICLHCFADNADAQERNRVLAARGEPLEEIPKVHPVFLILNGNGVCMAHGMQPATAPGQTPAGLFIP